MPARAAAPRPRRRTGPSPSREGTPTPEPHVSTASPVPTYVLLYVRSPAESAAFYADLLGRTPVEQSPTFALFVLDGGYRLGLWVREGVVPAAAQPLALAPADASATARCELAIAVADPAAVDALHAAWCARGVPVTLAPTALDFGYTFVAHDPDGHRVRVFAPAAEPVAASVA